MNENVERILDELDGFRIAGEMTYTAYSRLHDSISELNDLLKEQEAVESKVIRMNDFGHPVHACGKCGHLITESMRYCSQCGKAVKWT